MFLKIIWSQLKKWRLHFVLFLFPVCIYSQQTGIQNLNNLNTGITDSGERLSTTAQTTFGSATVNLTTISHKTGEFIEKSHQWILHPNNDRSPVLDIGSESFPTYIVDSYDSGNNWTTGGKFQSATAGGLPVIRFTDTNFRQSDTRQASAFGSNRMDIIVEAYRSNFAFHTTATTAPFFGILGIFEDSSIIGNNLHPNNNWTDTALFIGLPRKIKNLLIKNWYQFKIEQGMGGFFENLKFENVNWIFNAAHGGNTNAGRTDKLFHFLDSVIDKSKIRLSQGGGVALWRTFSAQIFKPDGTGLAHSDLHLLYQNGQTYTKWTEQYTRNAAVETHQGALRIVPKDFTVALPGSGGTAGYNIIIRDWSYLARLGEKWKISGFTQTANNGTFTVAGRDWNGTRFADPYAFYFSGITPVAETTRSITFEVMPPQSGSDGKFNDYKLEILYGRVNVYGGNAVTNANSRIVTTVLGGTDSAGGHFTRNNWKAVVIPPYPYQIQNNDFTIAESASEAGEKINWLVQASVDTNVSQTNSNTVANYAEINTLDQLYDRTLWWKRQKANQFYPTYPEELITANGNTLNLGTMNLIVDPNATTAYAVNTASHTITIKTGVLGVGTKFSSITTSGTITFQAGSTSRFGYKHQGGTKKYVEVRGLSASSVRVQDFSSGLTSPTILAQSSGTVSGTFRGLYDEPANPSNTIISINRLGFTSAHQKFPETALAYVVEPFLVQITGLKENQELIINYILKLLQKTEALRNRYRIPPAPTPTLTVTTTANTTTANATTGNQEKAIQLLLQIFRKLVSVEQITTD